MDWLLFIILVSAALVLSGAYYYIVRQQRKSNVCTDAQAVYHYIRSEFKKGFSEEKIKQDLSKLNWKADLPHEASEEETRLGSLQDQGALVLRFALGSIFFYQGLIKIIGHFEKSNALTGTGGMVVTIIGVLQIVFALLLIAGLWTRFVAALSALYLIQVAMMVAITGNFIGNSIIDTILLLTIAVTLVILGGGDASADRYAGLS